MTLGSSASAPPADDIIRVLVVDDSAVIRGFFSRFIEAAGGLKVVGSAANGELALSFLEKNEVDVVLLDIEMPVMDGITALPKILQKDPNIGVIMASSLTKENAALVMKCLQMGATECLAKPTSAEMQGSTLFQDTLAIKARAAGTAARRKRGRNKPLRSFDAASPAAKPAAADAPPRTVSLRPPQIAPRPPEVIAIGSSTGGPQALTTFFTDLKGPLRQPIFITQHMPPTFTAILADNIARHAGIVCREAKDGEVVTPGTAYVAPGNFHMTVKGQSGSLRIALNQEPPENFCRPSVDPMLRSLVEAYGPRILSVIFTGMGADGLKGCQRVVEAGGTVVAQDEASSVVWGMPGAVAMAGICTHVLPLDRMAAAVRDLSEGRGPRA
jgi:two-component system chemotaxis response regulator CheB